MNHVKLFESFIAMNEKNWLVTIDLKDVFVKYEENGDIREFCKTISDILEGQYEILDEKIGEEAVDELTSKVVDELSSCSDEEDVDFALANLYDWADEYDIFIEKEM